MDDLVSICQRCLNQRVLVSTRDGRVHEGLLVNFDLDNVYLDNSSAFILNKASKANVKAFRYGYGYGRNAILTLALFDILAISLVAGGAFLI